MSVTPGRSYPFPSRTSMFWETCHVTYDQAVEMFHAQTATQQAMGQNPIVSSSKLKRVKYSSIHDAQAEYSKQTVEKSLDFEKRILEVKETGNQSAKSLIDNINSYKSPTFDGMNDSGQTQKKYVGDDAKTIETHGLVFAKSCETEHGCVDVRTEEESIDNFGTWAVYGKVPPNENEYFRKEEPQDEPFSWNIFSQAHAGLPAVFLESQMALNNAIMASNVAAANRAAQNSMYSTPGITTRRYTRPLVKQLDQLSGSLNSPLATDFTWNTVSIKSLFAMHPTQFEDGTQYDNIDLRQNSSVKSRVRLEITDAKEGEYYPIVRAFHTGDGERIPVKYVGQDMNGQLSIAFEKGGPTIYWTPVSEKEESWQTTPSQDDGFVSEKIRVMPLHSDPSTDKTSTTSPQVEQADWRDAVLVFPEATGIKPLYVVYSIDYDGHIINAEINKQNRVVGGHSLLGNVEILPGSTKRYIGDKGVYEVNIGIRDPSNPSVLIPKHLPSSMFPEDWTAERIKEEVEYAFENREEFTSDTGAKMWMATTKSGVKVKGYLIPKQTVYPLE